MNYATTLLAIPRSCIQLASDGVLPMTNIQAAVLRYVLVGVALLLIVIYRPQGIFGNKKELTFVK